MSVSLVPPFAHPFVGNERVLRAVAEAFGRRREQGRPCRLNVHGMLGSGVTSLSTQLHRVHEEDAGTLLVWLPGELPDQRVTPVGELLGHLLRQADVPDADHGADDIERANNCKRVLARITGTRRVMVIIDNYRQFAQIQPLLEFDLPNLIVVVNTTEEQRELGARDFRFCEPEVLAAAEATDLFRYVLEETADEIADATIDRLVARCGGIPLVVRLLAAQLIGQPERAESLLAEIEAATDLLLSLDSERAIHRWLDFSYDALELRLQRTYRKLSVLLGTDFGVPVAAAVLGVAPAKLSSQLATLVKRHLLVRVKPNRYAYHPLVQDHARGKLRAEQDDGDDRLAGATEVRRAVDWYLREALPRARSMSQRWWVDPVTELLASLYDAAPPRFIRADADGWFESELPNVVAAVRLAHQHGLWRQAWTLCVALWNHLHVHQRNDLWIDTHLDGLRAARAAGDRLGVMQISSQLGSGYLAIKDRAAARRCFEESLSVALELGHALGEQSALEWLGKVLAAESRHEEALARYAESWVVAETKVLEPERAFATVRLQQARSLLALERWPAASAEAMAAAGFFDTLPNELNNSAKCRKVHGEALLGAGEVTAALPVLERMVELFEEDGAERPLADGRRVLAAAYERAGQLAEAASLYRLAFDYYERVGDEAAAEIRAKLGAR